MKKKKKNLEKKEFVFSPSYQRRKKELLDRMFGSKNCRKNDNRPRKEKDDIL